MKILPVLMSGMLVSGCLDGRKASLAELGNSGEAVASLSDIMSNIKCDMQEFVRDNPKLGSQGKSFGGVLTFTVGRTNDASGGVKFGIPIASTKLGGEVSLSRKVSYGQVVKFPFHLDYNEKEPLAECTSRIRSRPVLITTEAGYDTQSALTGPILGLADLRRQVDLIVPGQPIVYFTDYLFSGSVVLTRSAKAEGKLEVVVVSPSAASTISSEYRIDYEIGTDWRAIYEKGKFKPVANANAAAGTSGTASASTKASAIIPPVGTAAKPTVVKIAPWEEN